MVDPKSAKPSRNKVALRKREQKAFRELNDGIIEAYLVVRALNLVARQMDEGEIFKEASIPIFVPSSKNKKAPISRKRAQFRDLIKNCVESGEYKKSLTLCVAKAEDYVASILRLILKAYPDRLMRSIKGIDAKIQVDLEQIISAKRLEDIIEDRIRARIQQAIYAAPKQYLSYLNSVIQKEIPGELIEKFCEVKATRDIIVHAQGISNEVYREKAGQLARANVGEPLRVDRPYFEYAITVIKGVYDAINAAVREKYGDDEKLALALAAPEIPTVPI